MSPVRWVFPGAALLRPGAVSAARSSTRPAAAAAMAQRRSVTRGPDDLGGPGGQEAPPQNPGGPDVMKRNWPMIGGGVLGVLALYLYLTTGSTPKKGDLEKAVGKSEAELRHGARKVEEGLKGELKETEGTVRDGAAKLRGKKDGMGMGGFRSE